MDKDQWERWLKNRDQQLYVYTSKRVVAPVEVESTWPRGATVIVKIREKNDNEAIDRRSFPFQALHTKESLEAIKREAEEERKEKRIHICEVCGKRFESDVWRSTCSPGCLAIKRKINLEKIKQKKICPICEKEFIGKANQKYCSISCANKGGRRPKGPAGKGHRKTCPICEKKFYPRTSNQKYCSPVCAGRARRQLLEGPIAPKGPIKICPMCGEEFHRKNNRQKYCSERCSDEAKAQKKREWDQKKRLEANQKGTEL